MTEIRLCKDCKYFRRSGNLIDILFGDAWHSCSHPEVTDDVVNGKDRVYCKIARTYRCGYEGKFWEARK
jgi:hypothetical protein